MKYDGFMYGLNDVEYRSQREFLSASDIKTLCRDPFKYFKREIKAPSKAMIEGTLLHLMMIEPHLFDDKFLICDSKKEMPEDLGGREVIKSEQFERVRECAYKVKEDVKKETGIDLDKMDGEVSFFGEFQGRKAKCRADLLTKDKKATIDLKKTASADSKEFLKQVCNLDYCIQELWYREVMGLEAFWWLAIEINPLETREGNFYRWNLFEASENLRDKARQLIDKAFYALDNAELFQSPRYPCEDIRDNALGGIVKPLNPPLWYMN